LVTYDFLLPVLSLPLIVHDVLLEEIFALFLLKGLREMTTYFDDGQWVVEMTGDGQRQGKEMTGDDALRWVKT
jgi:hypothetical protein